MKILIVKRHPPYNVFLPDIKNAFQNLNCIAEIVEPEPSETLIEKIISFKPDYLFCISFFVYLSKIGNILKIPVIHYELDKIMNVQLFESDCFGEYDILFSTYKDDIVEFKKAGLANGFYLPFCYNIKRHTISDCDYKFELSFVGSLLKQTNNDYKTYLDFLKNKVADIPDLLPFYERYIKLLENFLILQFNASKNNSYILPKIISESTKSIKDILELFSGNAKILINTLAKEAAYKHRKYILSNIPNLTVFGNNDWEEVNWKNIKYYGFVDQYTKVSEVFYRSKINLDITRIYQLDGFSDRIFNVLYSEGFLCTNKTEAILELFDDGKDLVTYSNLEELLDKIKYYLKNEDERKRIAYSGYQKVLKEHSFNNRLKFILDKVKKFHN